MSTRKMMMTSARRWLVVPASVAFVMLASMAESSASDRVYRWIGDPRLSTDISAARRVQLRVHAPARVTVPSAAPVAPPMDSYASAPTSYGYGVGDNSRNQTW